MANRLAEEKASIQKLVDGLKSKVRVCQGVSRLLSLWADKKVGIDWNESKRLRTNEYMFVLLLCIQVADLGPAACGQHNVQEGVHIAEAARRQYRTMK